METTIDQPIHTEETSDTDFAPGIARLKLGGFVNAYLVGEPGGAWALVDTGTPGSAGKVRRQAAARFGDRPPQAILLTHGHFDHAGSAAELAAEWGAPVYAHRLELPYLTGRSDYPPQDPSVGGALGVLSRAFPHRGFDLGERVKELPADGSVPGLPGWRWIATPGHTAGHVSYLREGDGLLVAGDALATVNQDSAVAMLTERLEFSVPPAPFTTDWDAGRTSVEELAGLLPTVVAAGHGAPAVGPKVAADLARFAQIFSPPRRGRYVESPARADESGVVEVPPAPRNRRRGVMVAAGIAAGAGVALALARRRSASRLEPEAERAH
jgi:glyoxylase-like metal-dependent hydrolase (beta-lactamase superfamily II)